MAFWYPSRLAALLVVTMVTLTSGYDFGAPTSACTSMVPGHIGISRQTTTPPFNISTSASTYSAGSTITVTITATGSPLRGFLVQARRADTSLNTDTPLGTFTNLPANTQTITCTTADSSVTHTAATTNSFTTLTLTWTAPSPAAGHIEFKATLATGKSTYWVGVKSAIVSDPTAAAIVTTPASVQPTTTDTNPIDVTGCGSTKGCFRSPSGCTTSCDNIVTWAPSGSEVEIEISRKGAGWAGLGLSGDKSMGADSVIACLQDSTGQMMVSQSYNDGRQNKPISSATDGISNVRVGFLNGVQVCRFKRQKSVSGRANEIFDLNSNYYLIMAQGGVSGKISDGSQGINKHTTAPIVSTSVMSLLTMTDVSSSATISPLIKAHGCMMIIAWVITSSFGIFMARHYKKQWPGEKLFGKDVWFPLHTISMVSTLLFTVIAFIIIFVHVKGYSSVAGLSPAILQAHPVLGIIVTALAIINPVMAAFRPGPNAPKRYIFNWGHWGVGVTARVLAVITIFLGLNLPQVTVSVSIRNLTYVMIGFVCFYVLCEVLLEIHRCFSKSSGSSGSSLEMKSPGEPGSHVETRGSGSGQLFRNIMLGLLILGLLGFGLALVIVIAIV